MVNNEYRHIAGMELGYMISFYAISQSSRC
uniref:Uncharacterized protein n=2 Tax=Arundo donax TaxID=35708 RepID=A0A0A9HEA8_ARUDO